MVSGALKIVICKKFKRDNHLDYSPSQPWCQLGQTVYCKRYSGVDQPRRRCFACAPYWVSYSAIVVLGNPIEILISKPILKSHLNSLKAITPKTKMVVINSPNNPVDQFIQKKNTVHWRPF